jgi:hypothetical protein
MSVITYIKNNLINATATCCSEMGCELRLDDLSNYIVLSGEKFAEIDM